MSRLISFVIPCYGSENTIEGVVEEILCLNRDHTEDEYEIILVNDSSPDNVWCKIRMLSEKYSNIKAINLAKNFGQHAALLAGYRHSNGEIVVSLDDDGQIAVEDTYEIIHELDQGYDVVYGKYREKKHSKFRNWGSQFTKTMMVRMLDIPKDFEGSSFYAAKHFIIEEICKYPNPYVYLPGLIFRSTNKINSVFVGHRPRQEGRSGYSLRKLIALWVNGATTFSVKPLRISVILGVVFAVIGITGAFLVIINKILNPDMAAGWSSLISVILLLGGILLVSLGLTGEYVGRIYLCLNKAPQYVIRNYAEEDFDAKDGSMQS